MPVKIRTTIDLDYIKSVLKYCPLTGYTFWIKDIHKSLRKIGDRAGTIRSNGYRTIGVGRKIYQEHRIAYMLYHDRITESILDHINGDRSDNRISNLRESSAMLNSRNRVEHRNGGLLGVSHHKRLHPDCYEASILKTYLGCYPCKWQAAMAVDMYINGETVYGKNFFGDGTERDVFGKMAIGWGGRAIMTISERKCLCSGNIIQKRKICVSRKLFPRQPYSRISRPENVWFCCKCDECLKNINNNQNPKLNEFFDAWAEKQEGDKDEK